MNMVFASKGAENGYDIIKKQSMHTANNNRRKEFVLKERPGYT